MTSGVQKLKNIDINFSTADITI